MSMLDLHARDMFDFDIYRNINSAENIQANKYKPEKFRCFKFNNIGNIIYVTEIIVERFH